MTGDDWYERFEIEMARANIPYTRLFRTKWLLEVFAAAKRASVVEEEKPNHESGVKPDHDSDMQS